VITSRTPTRSETQSAQPRIGPVHHRLRRAVDGNALRAAVLGANDGLVSNFSLVMGVAGAGAGGDAVLIAGIAGLLAGSLSMALGEWLSVQSSRELYANQIDGLARELDTNPGAAEARLADAYGRRGLTADEGRRLARRMLGGERSAALDVVAREELGVDPEELGGSAWIAAITSFVLFGIGAAIPLVPFLIGAGTWAILGAAGLSGAALFGLGAAITRLTGRHPLWAGLRQLAFGMAAAAVTYGIGTLLGATIA
jgi:VIT1/CCC1 family predicted Fe2+/Mn2+ transporter